MTCASIATKWTIERIHCTAADYGLTNDAVAAMKPATRRRIMQRIPRELATGFLADQYAAPVHENLHLWDAADILQENMARHVANPYVETWYAVDDPENMGDDTYSQAFMRIMPQD